MFHLLLFLQVKVVLRADVCKGTYDKVAVVSGNCFSKCTLLHV